MSEGYQNFVQAVENITIFQNKYVSSVRPALTPCFSRGNRIQISCQEKHGAPEAGKYQRKS